MNTIMKHWKAILGLACVGVGGYLAYRWYRGRGTTLSGLGGRPRWMGYGRPSADYALAKAFGANTAQTVLDPPIQPNVAAGDVPPAPSESAFTDDDTGEADF